ncbi:Arc family DNA-binding protein [Comamonas sp.]|uniref:Arc family DNA-binding protein n=1 Tax=Comamonas sp. TaxID=34028 RepID=UPI00346328FE
MQVGRGSPAVMVRMTVEMKAWFKHKAIDNRRTLNAEILFRLEESRKAEEAKHDKQA